ncbi:MAG TPA: hypothetical protein ENI54_07020 [bacterium]|nr:hypothetical protein [bacterium]
MFRVALKPIFYKYLIMVAINVTPFIGGKYISTAYAVYNKMNPYASIALITVSETLLCLVFFYIGLRLKSLKWIHKLINPNKTRKAHNYILKYGSVIGLFVGQMFIGAPPISFALGLIYESDKNIFLYLFIPLFTSIFLYAVLNFYLNTVAITSIENIFHFAI